MILHWDPIRIGLALKSLSVRSSLLQTSGVQEPDFGVQSGRIFWFFWIWIGYRFRFNRIRIIQMK